MGTPSWRVSPSGPFRLWKCCRKDLPHPWFVVALCKSGTALPVPWAWPGLSVDSACRSAAGSWRTVVQVYKGLPVSGEIATTWGLGCFFEILSISHAWWKDFALETTKLSMPVSCLNLARNYKVGISALCSPRCSITYVHQQLGWLRTVSGLGVEDIPRSPHWCYPGHGQHVLSQLQHLHLQSKVTQQESPRQQQVMQMAWAGRSGWQEAGKGVMWTLRHFSIFLGFQGPRQSCCHTLCAALHWASAHCQVWAVETIFFQNMLRN